MITKICRHAALETVQTDNFLPRKYFQLWIGGWLVTRPWPPLATPMRRTGTFASGCSVAQV